MYKKRYGRRRRRYNKRRGTNWGNIAKKAFKTAKWVAGLVNAEKKTYYREVVGITGTSAGTSWNVIEIPQGDSSNSRNGDSVKVKNLHLTGSFTRNGSDETVRMLVVLDKQNTLNATTLLRTPTNAQMIVYQPKSEDQFYHSKLLYDKCYNVNTYKPEFKFNIKLKINEHINYNSGSTTVNTNAIKVFYYTQNAIGSTLIEFQTVATYYDN